MDEVLIKEKYPSICYDCDNSRKVGSETNQEKGFVGCCLRVLDKHQTKTGNTDHWAITEGKEVLEGWVDLRSKPFKESSGHLTNYQLITFKIDQCDEYR